MLKCKKRLLPEMELGGSIILPLLLPPAGLRDDVPEDPVEEDMDRGSHRLSSVLAVPGGLPSMLRGSLATPCNK